MEGDKFMPGLHLKQPEFTYSASGPLTKFCERTQKITETGKLKHLFRNELDKACFGNGAAYSDSKDLAKRTILDKISKDRDEITRNHKSNRYHIYSALEGMKTGSQVKANKQLAEQLDEPVVKELKRRKAHVRLKDNIRAADLVETRSLPSNMLNVDYKS